MTKLNVKIIVQGQYQNAEKFAEQLTSVCEEIQNDHIHTEAEDISIQFTTSREGRQTANILYHTR